MAQGSLYVSKALSNVSYQYQNPSYIFQELLKDVNVINESGQYYIYDKDFRLEETERANGAEANMATFKVSTGTYLVREHALKDVITDRDYGNTDKPMNLDVDTTEHLTDKILMRQEKMAHDLLFTTTGFSNNETLTTQTSFNYYTSTSVPIQKMLSITSFINAQCGQMPNVIVMGVEPFNGLKENTNIYSRLAYTRDQILTEQLLASVFDVNKVLVGRSIYQTNQEGITATQTAIWGNDCLVGYFNPSPGVKKMTAAQNYRISKYGNPYKVKKYRDEKIEGNYIEVQTMAVPKVVCSLCGYLIKSAYI
ncbi:MAG: hypothetical protein GY853_02370 [PVC group bacterium]|nr:hypothetical protein [PVC group bacterium]